MFSEEVIPETEDYEFDVKSNENHSNDGLNKSQSSEDQKPSDVLEDIPVFESENRAWPEVEQASTCTNTSQLSTTFDHIEDIAESNEIISKTGNNAEENSSMAEICNITAISESTDDMEPLQLTSSESSVIQIPVEDDFEIPETQIPVTPNMINVSDQSFANIDETRNDIFENENDSNDTTVVRNEKENKIECFAISEDVEHIFKNDILIPEDCADTTPSQNKNETAFDVTEVVNELGQNIKPNISVVKVSEDHLIANYAENDVFENVSISDVQNSCKIVVSQDEINDETDIVEECVHDPSELTDGSEMPEKISKIEDTKYEAAPNENGNVSHTTEVFCDNAPNISQIECHQDENNQSKFDICLKDDSESEQSISKTLDSSPDIISQETDDVSQLKTMNAFQVDVPDKQQAEKVSDNNAEVESCLQGQNESTYYSYLISQSQINLSKNLLYSNTNDVSKIVEHDEVHINLPEKSKSGLIAEPQSENQTVRVVPENLEISIESDNDKSAMDTHKLKIHEDEKKNGKNENNIVHINKLAGTEEQNSTTIYILKNTEQAKKISNIEMTEHTNFNSISGPNKTGSIEICVQNKISIEAENMSIANAINSTYLKKEEESCSDSSVHSDFAHELVITAEENTTNEHETYHIEVLKESNPETSFDCENEDEGEPVPSFSKRRAKNKLKVIASKLADHPSSAVIPQKKVEEKLEHIISLERSKSLEVKQESKADNKKQEDTIVDKIISNDDNFKINVEIEKKPNRKNARTPKLSRLNTTKEAEVGTGEETEVEKKKNAEQVDKKYERKGLRSRKKSEQIKGNIETEEDDGNGEKQKPKTRGGRTRKKPVSSIEEAEEKTESETEKENSESLEKAKSSKNTNQIERKSEKETLNSNDKRFGKRRVSSTRQDIEEDIVLDTEINNKRLEASEKPEVVAVIEEKEKPKTKSVRARKKPPSSPVGKINSTNEKESNEDVLDKSLPKTRRGRSRKNADSVVELAVTIAEIQPEQPNTRGGRSRRAPISYKEDEGNEDAVPEPKKAVSKRPTKRLAKKNVKEEDLNAVEETVLEESKIKESNKSTTGKRTARKRNVNETLDAQLGIENESTRKEDLVNEKPMEPPAKRATRTRAPKIKESSENIINETIDTSTVVKEKRETKPVAAVQQYMDNVRARVATPKRLHQVTATSTPQSNKKGALLPNDISALVQEETRSNKRRVKNTEEFDNTTKDDQTPAPQKTSRGGKAKIPSKATSEIKEKEKEKAVEVAKPSRARRGVKAVKTDVDVDNSIVDLRQKHDNEKNPEDETNDTQMIDKSEPRTTKTKRGVKRQPSEPPVNTSSVSSRSRRNVRFDVISVETEDPVEGASPPKRVTRARRK